MCSVESRTISSDPLLPVTVVLSFEVTNTSTASGACNPGPVVVTAVAAQTDAFADATSIGFAGAFATPPVLVPAASTVQDSLVITFPAGAAVGERTFDVSLLGMFAPTTCTARVSINNEIRLFELNGNNCCPAGTQAEKTFRIANLTNVQRTVSFSVTSTQKTSAPGNGDHFPIALKGDCLGAGDPLDPLSLIHI